MIIILVLVLNVAVQEAIAAWRIGDVITVLNKQNRDKETGLFLITGNDSILAVNAPSVLKTMSVVITAYSSTPDQTDDTPFITASNTRVRDGIVAANFLAFGTRVRIPELFGDKIFTVEDRMARKNSDKMDIWFPERHLAKRFGVQKADVIILD